jgi:hypothetical protein
VLALCVILLCRGGGGGGAPRETDLFELFLQLFLLLDTVVRRIQGRFHRRGVYNLHLVP